MNEGRFYLNVLVVLAIIFAGISPACHFISGKGSIQICAADGSVQTVEVDAEFDPFFVADNEPPKSTPSEDLSEKCPFCFAASHQKFADVKSVHFEVPHYGGYLKIGGGTFVPASLDETAYQPRAPPAFS